MDANLATVIIAVAIAVIVIAAFFIFRQNVGTEINLPLGFTLKLKGSNKKPTGDVTAEDVTVSDGGLNARSTTGGKVTAKKIKTKKGVNLNSSSSPK